MRYSKYFAKTKKEAPTDETSISAKLLMQAGFIQKEMAGVYVYLPMGLRVLDKIIQIIREEMNAIEGQEVLLSSLQNPEVWQKSGRWDDEVVDVWFKTQLKNGTEVGLANTHEEALTNLMTKYIQSYKDLPMYVYQFQTKFRNEIRAKSGIMRTREFIMKDLYSFNLDQEGLDEYYERAKEAYVRVFNRLGLGDRTYVTFASGGSFSKFSHEFQTICEAGEDIIYLHEGTRLAVNKEVYQDEVLAELGLKKDELVEYKSIEVGNIFKLGTKYSAALGLDYQDEHGNKKPVYMGSYGIGPGRGMGTVAEVCSDERGLIWPESIAPYRVHLVGLNMDDADAVKKSEEVYQQLTENGVEVLFDDRNDRTVGEKLADADLIGCPVRVVVSKRNADKLEVKRRNESSEVMLTTEELLKYLA